MRRAKRILQDDQNEFLDAMRRQKAKVDPTRLLPGLELQVAVWAEVLAPAVDTVYRGGPRATIAPGARAPPRPKRSRERPRRGPGVAAAGAPGRHRRDGAHDGPYAAGLRAARVARCRDRRPVPRVAIARISSRCSATSSPAAYARGVVRRRAVGCPSALGTRPKSASAPTATTTRSSPRLKGQPFPTGQPCPPAHPGCRCLVVRGRSLTPLGACIDHLGCAASANIGRRRQRPHGK